MRFSWGVRSASGSGSSGLWRSLARGHFGGGRVPSSRASRLGLPALIASTRSLPRICFRTKPLAPAMMDANRASSSTKLVSMMHRTRGGSTEISRQTSIPLDPLAQPHVEHGHVRAGLRDQLKHLSPVDPSPTTISSRSFHSRSRTPRRTTSWSSRRNTPNPVPRPESPSSPAHPHQSDESTGPSASPEGRTRCGRRHAPARPRPWPRSHRPGDGFSNDVRPAIGVQFEGLSKVDTGCPPTSRQL